MTDQLAKRRKKIRQAMAYAVPEGRLQEAMELLDLYRDDYLGLMLLLEFYSFLPEAAETCVSEIRLVARQRGVHLLAAMTDDQGYLYLVSDEGIEFHGTLSDGYLDRDLLDFFEFPDLEHYQSWCRSADNLETYEPMQVDVNVCPACHVATGEYHELGCPVEICPWCGGQLIHCNCRFDRLGLDFITSEQELIRFEEMLDAQGRIPYAPEQRPHFLDDGGGVAFD